ncbi:MAG: hypothetical protein NTZ56_01080 [Acidobacteria bacterium]|nr:hypothetical protein [Acidobacteriota bacterium]
MLKPALLLALAAISATRLWAWGDQGHELIGKAAQERLAGTKALATIQKWFGGPVDFAKLATCADNIRGAQRNGSVRPDCLLSAAEVKALPPTENWHHMNLVVPPVAGQTPAQALAAAAAQNPPRVVAKIEEVIKQLSNKKLKDHDRAVALMWLLHFGGDIHQPLHAVARNNDKGGNDVTVSLVPGARGLNLHSVWDSTILRSIQDPEAKVKAAITPAMASKLKPSDWALESWTLAQTVVYKGVRVPSGKDDVVQLTQQYITDGQPVVIKRLAEAGVRLAEIIKKNVK